MPILTTFGTGSIRGFGGLNGGKYFGTISYVVGNGGPGGYDAASGSAGNPSTLIYKAVTLTANGGGGGGSGMG